MTTFAVFFFKSDILTSNSQTVYSHNKLYEENVFINLCV